MQIEFTKVDQFDPALVSCVINETSPEDFAKMREWSQTSFIASIDGQPVFIVGYMLPQLLLPQAWFWIGLVEGAEISRSAWRRFKHIWELYLETTYFEIFAEVDETNVTHQRFLKFFGFTEIGSLNGRLQYMGEN